MAAIRYSLRLASVTSLAATYGMPAHPSSIGSSVANRRSHAKMPSTRLVPAMFQTSMMQRGRFWEGMLQRLSGPRQRAAGEGSPNGRTSEAALVRRVERRIGPRGAKHPLPEPGTRIKKETPTLRIWPAYQERNTDAKNRTRESRSNTYDGSKQTTPHTEPPSPGCHHFQTAR